jgi:hypothetical protein
MSNFEGSEKLFKSFPVILHLNNKFQELYLPNQDISIDEITEALERLSVFQTVPASQGIKIWNQNLRAV